jgi:hypothetical protein
VDAAPIIPPFPEDALEGSEHEIFSAGGGTGAPPEPPAPPERRRLAKWPLVLVFLAAAALGYYLFRRSPAAAPAPAAAGPPAGALIATAPVQLTPKAAVIADRFLCLCGECSDTLGACTCTRDQGSNEMKSTLNRLAEEKKSIAEIEAAMIEKYGERVLIKSSPGP